MEGNGLMEGKRVNGGQRVVGLIGAMYRIEQQDELEQYLCEILPAARFIERNYESSVSMSEMAALTGLSSTHFNRRFRKLLRMTPMQYLRSIRVQAAQKLLTTTSRSLAQIAAGRNHAVFFHT